MLLYAHGLLLFASAVCFFCLLPAKGLEAEKSLLFISTAWLLLTYKTINQRIVLRLNEKRLTIVLKVTIRGAVWMEVTDVEVKTRARLGKLGWVTQDFPLKIPSANTTLEFVAIHLANTRYFLLSQTQISGQPVAAVIENCYQF